MDDVERLLSQGCQLIVALETAIGHGPRAVPDSPGLDTPQLGVLVALDLFGSLRPSELSALLGLSSARVTKIVARLERSGAVRREADAVPADRRAVVISITAEGRAALRRVNEVLSNLALEFAAVLATIDPEAPGEITTAPSTDLVPGEQPITSAPALAELLRVMAEIDRPIDEMVGHLAGLHPSDPRGLLVLSEINLRGPIRSGALATLIDRSRSSANHLIDELAANGLVERVSGTVADDRRGVVVDLTPVGRALIRGVVAAVTAQLPTVRPAAVALLRALGGERQALGHATS